MLVTSIIPTMVFPEQVENNKEPLKWTETPVLWRQAHGTYFFSSIWIPWYQPIPLFGAPHPTSTTSAWSLPAFMEIVLPYDLATVLVTALRLLTKAKEDARPARLERIIVDAEKMV